jgi:aminomuconate-semialdehyde/2-hydroxymuconate-6-semialdehyde dehydrogenase
MGFAERGALLHRFADLIEANADALALADTTDMGKPVSDARSLAAEQHYRKVRSYLDGIEADGGTIRTGGLGDGWMVLPTVVENAPPDARLPRGGLRPGGDDHRVRHRRRSRPFGQ